ncbi:MAG: dCTP deaminase [Deltaproteobacteria bacterium]|nr:dCTP deaminase [Deltaproteobacteria bacterium]MCX7953345.1 dCTP deaminase [Deltaproteobacteria bacterium]
MIKPDKWIIKFGQDGGISPFISEQVNPASYDVRVGNHFICPTRTPDEVVSDHFTLYPGEVTLATTIETVCMPRNVCGLILLKSSLGRLWLNHSLSGWIDPGFRGQLTLEFQNIGPVPRTLRAGSRVAQIVFFELTEPPCFSYDERSDTHYKNQTGATRAWSDDFFKKT